MTDLKRRIIAEFSAKNKAKGATAAFRRDMDSTGQAMKRMAKGALALAGVGGGLYALKSGFMAVVKAASDAEETQAKFDTVFKSLSKEANEWAKSFGQEVGRSEQNIKSWMARLQDTFVPLGITREESLKLAQSLTTLAVDVASFNNAADADVIRDFTSALVGNHETVRKFGIIISETAIKQEAMRQGFDKTYKELTDLEKVQLRYELILRGTTDAQGDAIRTGDSYANQVKRLTGEYENLKVEVGSHVIPVLTEVISLFNEVIEQHNRLKDIPWFPEPDLGPSVIEKWEQQQLEESPFIKAAEEFHDIEIQRIKDAVEEWRKYFNEQRKQTEMMKEHYDKLTAMGGTYQEMQERMARQRYETELAVVTQQMEAETVAAEKIAEIRETALEKAEEKAFEYSSAFRNAIEYGLERSMRDFTNWKEHALDMLEEVYWGAIRVAFIRPAADVLAGIFTTGASALLGGLVGGGEEGPGTPPGGWEALRARAGLQYGGTVLETGWAKVHRGETYSGVGRGEAGGVTVNVNNDGMEKFEVSQAEQYWAGDQRVVDIFITRAQTDGPLRRSIKQAAR